MEKVVILIAGLSLIVPVADTRTADPIHELRILLPHDAPDQKPGSRAKHVLRSRMSKDSDATKLDCWVDSGASPSTPVRIEITKPGSLSRPTQALGEIADLAQLALASGAKKSRVKDECVLWDVVTGPSWCKKASGESRLHAMIRIQGAWSVGTVSYEEPAGVQVPKNGPVPRVEWTFKPKGTKTPAPGSYPTVRRKLAEGIVLVGDVADPDAVVHINGVAHPLRKGAPEVCAAAGLPSGQECHALELVNFPLNHHSHQKPEFFHFLALDELLDRPKATVSWIPKLESKAKAKNEEGETLVANQCFGGGHPWP